MHFKQIRTYFIAGCIIGLLMTGCAPHHYQRPEPTPSTSKRLRDTIPQTPSAPAQTPVISPSLRPLGSPNGYQKQAYKALQNKNYHLAESFLERAIRSQPNNCSLWYDLARVKYFQGDYHQSNQLSKKALRLARNNNERKYIKELISGSQYHLQ
ncbi:tetratricopeptide repeat protein [Desulfogranum japonicum]|uniref:tetratricopeptide repeat protein n=1 Tax=Desulfogranum japonicum TaxID=231447 RepID=UPI00048E756C|nr:tetratricopeptide repeat protein [Desulfogranum japonicum]